MIVVDVDVRPVSPNRLHEEHYYTRARRRRLERGATFKALSGHARPTPPVIVTFVRCASRLTDDDNLAYGFKAVRDAVAEWLGVTDGPNDHRARWRYAQCAVRVENTLRDRVLTKAKWKVWAQVKIVEVQHVA
jgi:hypothetical protein